MDVIDLVRNKEDITFHHAVRYIYENYLPHVKVESIYEECSAEEKLGLISQYTDKRTGRQEYRDFSTNRLMIPITDTYGQTVGFAANLQSLSCRRRTRCLEAA